MMARWLLYLQDHINIAGRKKIQVKRHMLKVTFCIRNEDRVSRRAVKNKLSKPPKKEGRILRSPTEKKHNIIDHFLQLPMRPGF